MRDKEKIEALKQFKSACNEMLIAQNHLAVVTKVDFTGVYLAVYNAREITEAWLKTLEKNENI